MSKKTASLIAFIMMIVFLVMSFIPCVFVEVFMKQFSMVAYKESYRITENMLYVIGLADANSSDIFSIITLVLVAIGIVALVFQFAGRSKKIIKILSFSPCVAVISFVIMTLLFCVFNKTHELGDAYYSTYEPGWGFYILAALLLCSAVLSFLIATEKLKNTPKSSTAKLTVTSNADELKKYKELLEAGVITQEEFDAKKKQLLGL